MAPVSMNGGDVQGKITDPQPQQNSYRDLVPVTLHLEKLGLKGTQKNRRLLSISFKRSQKQASFFLPLRVDRT